MTKKLLIMSASILLILTLGFAIVPAHVAHADSCNVTCDDPVVAGCTSLQYPAVTNHFNVNNQTWAIQLMRTNATSSACAGEEWASIVVKPGENPNLPNSIDIQVVSSERIHSPEGGIICNQFYDVLNSSYFGSGAYTNMIPSGNFRNYAQYDGNSQDPRAGPTGSAC